MKHTNHLKLVCLLSTNFLKVSWLVNLNLSKLPLLRCCFPSVRLLVNAFPISKTRSKISESYPFIRHWAKSTICHVIIPLLAAGYFCKTFANRYWNAISIKRRFSNSHLPRKFETHLHLSFDDRLFFQHGDNGFPNHPSYMRNAFRLRHTLLLHNI